MMQAVGAIHAAAAKKVKRASQDEQNELLDALRRQKGRLTSVAVVPTAEAHSLAWAGVLRTCLDEAHVAGSRLSETSTTSGRSGGPLLVCPDAVVKELVVAVVGGLRERIVLAIDSGEADSATDRVNARYREWKSQQLDALLTDALVAAFVSGAFAMIPAGSTLQWVEADGGCCSECADNTLESVLKGAEFPTGHALPPAHPACRCAVVVLAN